MTGEGTPDEVCSFALGRSRYCTRPARHIGSHAPTPVPSEVAETTAGEREVEALAKVIRDAGISGVKGEHVGPFDLARADAVLASDWLAALLDRVRREEGERIAQAIEELPAHYVQSRRRGGTCWMQAVRTHEAVTIARAASVGRGEGL